MIEGIIHIRPRRFKKANEHKIRMYSIVLYRQVLAVGTTHKSYSAVVRGLYTDAVSYQ